MAILTLGVLGALYFYNLDGWLIDDDEGSFLYQAWRVSEGEHSYADFFSASWPLFPYATGAYMRLFGPKIWTARALSVVLALATASLLGLLARQFLPAEGALLAMTVFLLQPQVFRYGRRLYPEPFMLFLITLGLYLFVRGWHKRQKVVLSATGFAFAIATLFKPIGVLALAGCLLWILVQSVQQRTSWRSSMTRTLPLLLSFLASMVLALGLLAYRQPLFLPSVIGGHLVKNAPVIWPGIALLLAYFVHYAPALVFALPAAWVSYRKNTKASLLALQIPTAVAFLFLQRTLYSRYLMYLTPSIAILFVVALEPIRKWAQRSYLWVAVISAVLLPWLVTDVRIAGRVEEDTSRIVEMIRTEIGPHAILLSDYQELNFHARRQSTYLGSEISGAMIASGKITGKELVDEIEKYGVEMVILDVSPTTAHQLVNLPDYEYFHAYLKGKFGLLGQYTRSKQVLEVYEVSR